MKGRKNESEGLGKQLDEYYAALASKLDAPLHRKADDWIRGIEDGTRALQDDFLSGAGKQDILRKLKARDFKAVPFKRKTLLAVAGENPRPDTDSLLDDIFKTRNRLVEINMFIVHANIRNYINRGLDEEDLLQEGTLGLIWAADRFSVKYRRDFLPYARKCVTSWMMLALTEFSRLIRLTPYAYREMRAVVDEKSRLREILGREPAPEELAESLDIAEEKVNAALENARRQVMSMDAPLGYEDGEDFTLHDTLGDPGPSPAETIADRESWDAAEASLKRLSARDEYILRARFGVGNAKEQTLTELGEKFRLSHQAVNQAETYALKRMRADMESRGFARNAVL